MIDIAAKREPEHRMPKKETGTIWAKMVGFLTIRNILLGLTIILVVSVIGLTVKSMLEAQVVKRAAETSMLFNNASDEVAKLMIAVADERTATNSAYGFEGVPDDNFYGIIVKKQAVAVKAHAAFLTYMKDAPDFEGRQKYWSSFEKAWADYTDFARRLVEDVKLDGESRQLKIRDVIGAQNSLIDAASQLRFAYEGSSNTGQPQIELVKLLKRQLWQMIEYAARDASVVGENIASGRPINAVKLQIVSQYSGVVSNSWETVKAISELHLDGGEIHDQLQEIQEVFFDNFEFLKDDVYSAAETESEYPISALEWVLNSQVAAEPVFRMSEIADKLARVFNEEAVHQANVAVSFSILGLVGALLIGVGAGFVVIMRVVRPINVLSATMQRLADGRLDTNISYTNGRDEMGDMARSVLILKENAIERQRLEATQREKEREEIERKAEEERRQLEAEAAQRKREEEQNARLREERRQAMLQLADQFEASVLQMVEGVLGSASAMEKAASGMTNVASETSEKSALVARISEQASANVNMVAAAAEELSSSVREITGQTNQSSVSARDAVARTERAGADVANLVQAAQKIGDVVKLINDIAEQTNLLALNATIEAARAGEAGRGFAVVASEVKSLANQTAQATQEISGQVEGMQAATGTAVKAIDQIREIIREIDSTAMSIASAVEEQDASTQEIARNVAEVSSGTQEVTNNIYGVNEGAKTTGTAANQVLSAAQEMTTQSTALRKQVEEFLARIRASD